MNSPEELAEKAALNVEHKGSYEERKEEYKKLFLAGYQAGVKNALSQKLPNNCDETEDEWEAVKDSYRG